MKYHLTVERTYRIGIEFESSDEKSAKAKAVALACNIGDEIFSGDIETDYALCDDEGKTIIDWD